MYSFSYHIESELPQDFPESEESEADRLHTSRCLSSWGHEQKGGSRAIPIFDSSPWRRFNQFPTDLLIYRSLCYTAFCKSSPFYYAKGVEVFWTRGLKCGLNCSPSAQNPLCAILLLPPTDSPGPRMSVRVRTGRGLVSICPRLAPDHRPSYAWAWGTSRVLL